TQAAIALLLAMSAFFLLYLLNRFLTYAPFLANWISPDALALPEKQKNKMRGVLSVGLKFWVSYAVLCLFSLLSGALWALASEKGWSLTKKFSKRVSKLLNRDPQEACESTLRWIVDELKKKEHGPTLVKVYTLDGDRDKPLIGWWDGYSETEKEIALKNISLCEADPHLNDLLKLQYRHCWINHNSGVVIEFLEVDQSQHDGFKNHIYNSYSNKVNAWEAREEQVEV
ncbi:MAG: hypothetical protein IJT22_06135, partial [Synergistaceae bacterium]|nr:hypothetical protein [Synergistaceae bacterium]